MYRAIEKKRFKRWIESELGPGIKVNPHIAAFPLVAQVVDEYLQKIDGNPLGIFISDEQAEVAPDIEKSLRLLRGEASVLRLNRIIEKGFFIPSEKSLPL